MKLIPESLEESVNFERGLDPKTVMRIGQMESVYIDFMKGDYDDYKIISSDEGKYFVSLKTAEKIFQKCKKYKEGTNVFDEEIEVRIFEGFPLTSLINDYGILSIWTRNKDSEKIILLMRNQREKSLKESVNFERGLDPKRSMDIGINRPLKPGDRVILLSVYDKEPFDKGVIKRIQDDGGIVLSHPTQGEIVYSPDYVVRESLDFQRGIDPKASMGIGDAAILPPLIDSNVLEAVSMLDSYTKDEYKEFMEDGDDPEARNYEFVKRVQRFIKGKVTFGKYFDWKEQDEMEEYIKKYARGRFVYNGTPGQDGWQVIFSKIHFPRAEEIDIS